MYDKIHHKLKKKRHNPRGGRLRGDGADFQLGEKALLSCLTEHKEDALFLCTLSVIAKVPYLERGKVKVTQLCPTFATQLSIQSMEFSRPEY